MEADERIAAAATVASGLESGMRNDVVAFAGRSGLMEGILGAAAGNADLCLAAAAGGVEGIVAALAAAPVVAIVAGSDSSARLLGRTAYLSIVHKYCRNGRDRGL